MNSNNYDNNFYGTNHNNNNNNNNNNNFEYNNPSITYNNIPDQEKNINKDNLIYDDNDEENMYASDAVKKSLRLGFIKKVYGVLSAQLLITALISSIGFIDEVKKFYLNSIVLFWVSFGLSICVLLPLICFKSVAKKVPINYILLFIFTICEAVMLSYMIAYVNDWKTVVTAASITILVTLGLTLYACTTKTDFTFLGGMLFVCSILLLCLGIFSLFFGNFINTLYCVLGVLLYSIYLIFDTQLIMGKFGHEFEIDDYIVAALSIYLDIIQIFIYILSILNNNRR